MSVTTPQPTTPPRKRRWYQFSLRTLFVVMLLASVGMSWFAVKMQQARRQREAVAAIRKTGGSVTYRHECLPLGSTAIPEPPGPRWLRTLLGEDFFARVSAIDAGTDADDEALARFADNRDVEFLFINCTMVTDKGMSYVAGFKQLRVLGASCTKVTDEGMRHLKGLSRLESLGLSGNTITDAGLASLRELSQLEELSLNQTQISDLGLEHLKNMHRLGYLDLAETQITDGGLERLAGLTELVTLYLGGTQVTEGGIMKLQKSLPKCGIDLESRHNEWMFVTP